ncbi:MAG: VPLPA-CTERM sorting domain-containing protein [Pseudomonadota bacterium]
MTKITKTLVLFLSFLVLPLPALAVPISAAGFYEFDGDGTVDSFRLEFDTVINVESDTEFVGLPLVSGSLTVGEKTFSNSVFLRFARNAFGQFGALVLSQDENPFAGATLPDFFQISAVFAPGTDLQTIMTQQVSAPLIGFDYIVAGPPLNFSFGSNTGLGQITFSQPTPVPLPAGGVLLISALGLVGARRWISNKSEGTAA